jgi:hypothetical protein
MNLSAFRKSLEAANPPEGTSTALSVMWHAAKGDWEIAHKVAQSDKSENSAWAHAYLHRVEGDLSNARYWYQNAGRPEATVSLSQEWDDIVTALLS